MLASRWSDRKQSYDFVVVGSGYGGAVTAARLATANVSPKPTVCILERGREWPVGSFPTTLDRFTAEQRSSLNPLGLYETLDFRDISVIKACGLGGGSLINFNAAVIPDPEAFETADWPRTIRRDTLEPYYRRAAAILRLATHPNASALPKFRTLDRAARAFGSQAKPLSLTVNFDIDGVNEYGVPQSPCNDCGDCFTGCNSGGKNTLAVNYLPMAHRAGAEIYTQMNVERVEKLGGGGWRVHGSARDGRRESAFTLDARNVILAAGALNTTEILLRSEMHGFKPSPRLGSRFSGNGDFFGLAYNSDHVVQALGIGSDSAKAALAPGPTMVGIARGNGGRPILERFIVEEGVIPSAFVRAAQVALPMFRGEDTDSGDERAERARALYDVALQDAYRGGALRNTLFLLITSMDDAKGSILFEAPWWERDGRIRIIWDDAGQQAIFARLNAEIRRIARELGATFVESPFWSAFNLRRLATLHPLGGCPAGEDYMHGAADEFGRVFSSDGSIHEGLFVADGALLPGSIGANPLMTISAMAERIAERKIEQLKGNQYPERPLTVAVSPLAAEDVIGVRDEILDRLFQRSQHIGTMDRLVNTGAFEVDLGKRRIRNDVYWKGYLPRGLPLNELSQLLSSGYYKQVRKEGDRYPGFTGYLEGRIPVYHSFEEINVEKRTNDLDPGRYILVRYTRPPLEGVFYDVMKMVNDDLILYRGYTGEFPSGVRGFTAPLVRSYSFQHMSAIDHQRLFEVASVPANEDLIGTWRLDAVANATQSPALAWLTFDSGTDGRLESSVRFRSGIERLLLPSFVRDYLEGFNPFRREIRKLDGDFLIGKYVAEVPPGWSRLAPAGSLGLLHSEPESDGGTRVGFYYLLTRTAEEQTAPGMLDALLELRLPAGVGVSFDEIMDGVFDSASYRAELKIEIPDLAAFLADSRHEAKCSGSLTFGSLPGAGAGTFTIDGRKSRVEFLTGNADVAYFLCFTAGGRRLALHGSRSASDYSTLRVRVREQDAVDAAAAATASSATSVQHEIGTGQLRLAAFETAMQSEHLEEFLLSLRVTGTRDPELKNRARLAFFGLTTRAVVI